MFGAIFQLGDGGIPIDATRLAAWRQMPRDKGGLDVESFGSRAALVSSSKRMPDGIGEEPCIRSLDDRFWLVGHIRLDARDELIGRLAAKGDSRAATASDAELCLLAYAAWGGRFVDYLLGDFSFVIWDAQQSRLIAVVDQMGVRQLFHARAGNLWFVGDRLDWVAGQESVDRELDDYWIADFLSIGFPREFGRTVYRGIRRMAPGHFLRLDGSGEKIGKYWQLELTEPLLLRSDRDYTDRFVDLLSRAIADRVPPAGRVGILMSGGLDSTTMAACAVGVVKDPARVVAQCEHYRKLMDIGEEHFASLAARRLGIDLQVKDIDGFVHDPEWRRRGFRVAEPTITVLNARNFRQVNGERAALAAVWFQGEGPDNALCLERDAYLSWLARSGRWRQLATALVRYVGVKGPVGWAQSFRRYFGREYVSQYYGPRHLSALLDRDLVARLRLDERAETLGHGGDQSHPWHPEAVASFTSPIWQAMFDDYAIQEILETGVNWRHPYVDLRVLHFMLSVPPIPWGWKKHLTRRAMRGRLPDEVLAREKTPLTLDPDLVIMRCEPLPELLCPGELARYVDLKALPSVEAPDRDLRVRNYLLALDYWLANRIR